MQITLSTKKRCANSDDNHNNSRTTAKNLPVKKLSFSIFGFSHLGHFHHFFDVVLFFLKRKVLGIAAEEYGSTFFKNGARPSGILTHPNTVKDPKRLRESWNAAYGGSSNGSKVAILEENMWSSFIRMKVASGSVLE